MQYMRLVALVLVSSACSSLPKLSLEQSASRAQPVFFNLAGSLVDSKSVMAGLKERGFTQDTQIAFHPGQHACEFIYVPKPNLQSAILEICSIDPTQPKDEIKEDVPTPPSIEWSLRVDENLSAYVEAQQSHWTAFGPVLTHKNYDWATNSRDRLPGWNFLEFNKVPIKGINLAFTEYEPKSNNPPVNHKARQERYSWRYHPNGVQVFLGALMVTSDPSEREAFESISGAKRRGDCSYLADGTWVQWIKSDSPLAQKFKDKLYPMRALVMGGDPKRFAETAKPDDTVDLNGRPAARIRLVKEAWDILVIKASTMDDMAPPAGPCGDAP